MLISLIGNLNNNFSSIARYLLEQNFDVRLYLFSNEPEHFAPSADMFSNILSDKTEILSFTSTLDIFDDNIIEQYKRIGKNSDLIIACGYAPAFFNAAGINIDILIPYGADIYKLPYYNFSLNPKYMIANYIFARHQKEGIKNASMLFMETQSRDTEVKIEKLRSQRERVRVAVPIIHDNTYQGLCFDVVHSSFYNDLKVLREKYDILAFHHSRHSWHNPSDLNEQKGNNQLFNGLAEFKNCFPDVKIGLVTLEYGIDVQQSKTLIKDLNIEECVHWFPKQKRKDLMLGISLSDIVIAELAGGYNLYGTVIEGLVMGKPVVQSREKDKYEETYLDGMHFALLVEDYHSIGDLLVDYWNNRINYNQLAGNGPKWYRDNIVTPFMERITAFINN